MVASLRKNRPLLIALLIVVVVLIWMARRYEPKVTASILLSGLTLGALYFLVASGLSLIFGLMDVLNFAQGMLFMMGAYVGYTVYANPRLILNTLPLAAALLGGVNLGAWASRFMPPRLKAVWGERALQVGLWAVAVLLILWGIRGFNLEALAAAAATATGGAVSTELAQESGAATLPRVVLFVVAGLAMGLALRRVGPVERRQATGRNDLLLGLILVAVGFVLIPLRTPAETLFLSLSSDLRFLVALVVAALAGAGMGALIEVSLIRPLYSRPIYQVLMTLGIGFVGTEIIKSIWGPAGFYMDIPAFFNQSGKDCPSPGPLAWFSDHCQSINILGRPFPSYRLFIIFLGVLMFVAIMLLLQRTRLGIIIRAGVQDSEMVQALGINVRRVFTLVFAVGTGLAALGGVAAAPFIGVNLQLAAEVQIQGFIAVVIGGMGSFIGSAVGSLIVGLARAFGDQLVLSGINVPWAEDVIRLSPSIARASTVLIMALVLLLKPSGLFGKKTDHHLDA